MRRVSRFLNLEQRSGRLSSSRDTTRSPYCTTTNSSQISMDVYQQLLGGYGATANTISTANQDQPIAKRNTVVGGIMTAPATRRKSSTKVSSLNSKHTNNHGALSLFHQVRAGRNGCKKKKASCSNFYDDSSLGIQSIESSSSIDEVKQMKVIGGGQPLMKKQHLPFE